MKRILILAVVALMAVTARGQTTQPARLTDLFAPCERAMRAEVAKLPNHPSAAQMAACKSTCDAIGKQWADGVLLQYVWYPGYRYTQAINTLAWNKKEFQCSAREHYEQDNQIDLIPVRAEPLFQIGTQQSLIDAIPVTNLGILTGQVVQAQAYLSITLDRAKTTTPDLSSVVAYPCLRAYLNPGNVIPSDFKPNLAASTGIKR